MGFTDGFRMGAQIGQQRLDNERRAEKDARKKVLQGREDETYAREKAKIKNVDAATQEYGLMQKTGVRNQANIQANDTDFDMAVEATGRGLAMPAATPQMPEWAPATALQDNQGLQKLSLAREDFNGLRALKTEERGLVEDDLYKGHLKSYTGSADQVGPTAKYLNTNSKSVSMGTQDKDGFVRLSIVKPNGEAEFLKLTKQDQAQLYAAGSMFEAYPERALKIMSGINKDLAAVIAAENGLTGKVADNANDVADKSAGRTETARHNRAVEADSSARVGLARTASKQARMGAPVQMLNDKGETVFAVPIMGEDNTVSMKQFDMGGLKTPRNITETQKAGLAAYYKALETLPPDAPQVQVDKLRSAYGVASMFPGEGGLSWDGAEPPAGKSQGGKPQVAPMQRSPAPRTYRVLQQAGDLSYILMPDGTMETASQRRLSDLQTYGFRQE